MEIFIFIAVVALVAGALLGGRPASPEASYILIQHVAPEPRSPGCMPILIALGFVLFVLAFIITA